MKQLIKPKEIVIYCGFALAFILLATLGRWDSGTVATVFSVPFIWIGSAIRYVGTAGLPLAYIVYILFGLSPLIYPIIRAIRTKKIVLRDITWLALSVFLFVILYYFINPHKIQYLLFQVGFSDQLKDAARSITLLGFSITAYAMLLFSMLCEAYARLKQTENRVYLYARILFSVLIVGVLFNLLFAELYNVKTAIANIPKDIDLIDSLNINRAVNGFAIVFAFILKIAPAVFTTLLFLRAKDFITNLQADAFSARNIPKLNAIIKTCTATVFVSLGATIAENVTYMLLSDKLLNSYYNIALPITMILAACLILIFAKILIKAIELSEENKLVI